MNDPQFQAWVTDLQATKCKSMVFHTEGFATSTGDSENNHLACVYAVNEQGFCLSLARFPEDDLVEVMVVDQLLHRTREIEVELSRQELRIRLSPAAAAQLEWVTEYIVPLKIADDEFHELDAALMAIFDGIKHGRYVRL